ncbi:hypothetical protein B0H13DRAFT_2355694 [Mycena leptocephala]|nr:hypothetical protein B0H13DRAFT_2355694 [Mycena leptocephala]
MYGTTIQHTRPLARQLPEAPAQADVDKAPALHPEYSTSACTSTNAVPSLYTNRILHTSEDAITMSPALCSYAQDASARPAKPDPESITHALNAGSRYNAVRRAGTRARASPTAPYPYCYPSIPPYERPSAPLPTDQRARTNENGELRAAARADLLLMRRQYRADPLPTVDKERVALADRRNGGVAPSSQKSALAPPLGSPEKRPQSRGGISTLPRSHPLRSCARSSPGNVRPKKFLVRFKKTALGKNGRAAPRRTRSLPQHCETRNGSEAEAHTFCNTPLTTACRAQ